MRPVSNERPDALPLSRIPPQESGCPNSPDAALDLREGIGDAAARACSRWPAHLRLRGQTAEGVRFVRGRCKATNLCDFCARRSAIETSEMLYLDAMEYAPTFLVVLTAREFLTRTDCRDHLRQLRR